MKQFARAEGTVELAADVDVAVGDALRILDNQIKHRVTLHTDLKPVPRVRADVFRLTQVLVNLVTNAVQAVPGPARSTGNVWIRTALADDGDVRIEVEDDGCGIRAHAVEHVFDPFYTTK